MIEAGFRKPRERRQRTPFEQLQYQLNKYGPRLSKQEKALIIGLLTA